MRWGVYSHFEDFLANHAAHQRLARDRSEASLSIAARARRRKKSHDVVEVEMEIEEILPDDQKGARHQLVRAKIVAIIESSANVDADLKRCMYQAEDVIISIRYGDRHGLPARIQELATGMRLLVRGEWIPKSRAYASGGEKTSVIHFTHDPKGFVCTSIDCYS